MKYIGIDYGHKRIGIALSDEGGVLATPFTVVRSNNNASHALEKIIEIIKENSVDMIIVGESINRAGEHNVIHIEAKKFAEAISQHTGIPFDFSKEFFSSVVARGNAGKETLHSRIRNIIGKLPPSEHADAKAAAVILQRYLDTIR